MGQPIELSALRERWWILLAEVERFLRQGTPDEALARARALRAETEAVLREHPALEASDLAEIRALAVVEVRRCARAAQARQREIAARGRAFLKREDAAIHTEDEGWP